MMTMKYAYKKKVVSDNTANVSVISNLDYYSEFNLKGVIRTWQTQQEIAPGKENMLAIIQMMFQLQQDV